VVLVEVIGHGLVHDGGLVNLSGIHFVGNRWRWEKRFERVEWWDRFLEDRTVAGYGR
jgi:hypothetical protein